MNFIPCIAILDVGKTNKKILVFNRDCELVYEHIDQIPEILDEDGFPCEDIQALSQWALNTMESLVRNERFDIKAINFSAYGASFVLLDEDGGPAAPLYNYLKLIDPDLLEDFYAKYGGKASLLQETASPALGNLNSGIQLYRLKELNPEKFSRIKTALHLPQYLSYLFTRRPVSELTSIGCHTLLWDFGRNQYHRWVHEEGIIKLFPKNEPAESAFPSRIGDKTVLSGIGLHDSSAALIPYLLTIREPFILLSTGTWSIALNPFNQEALSAEQLVEDCLFYFSYQGKPVKASRLFSGHEHDEEVHRIAACFDCPAEFYKNIRFDSDYWQTLSENFMEQPDSVEEHGLKHSGFRDRFVQFFTDETEAYYTLIADLVGLQVRYIRLILDDQPLKQIFVDGGFSKNSIFMHLLAERFPDTKVYAATVAQASALGAALVMHRHWNEGELPIGLVKAERVA